MGRGILDIPANAGTGGGGDFIPNLYFKEDKESARIRFLTEHKKIFYAQFHDTNDPPYRGDICVKAEFGQVCRKCDNSNQPRMKFLAWAFVYTHDYINEESAEKVGDYEVVKLRGGREVYRVEVDEAQLICFSAAHKGTLLHAIDRYGTLLDREYNLIRSGEAGYQRTTYLFEGDDEEEMPEELEELAENLPDLEDIATGEVETLGDDEEEEEKPRRKARRQAVEEEEEERPKKRAKKTRRPKRARKEEDDDSEDEDDEPLF